jgi:hypothetical protein
MSNKQSPKPPVVVGGWGSPSIPLNRTITGTINYQYPPNFPEDSLAPVKLEEIRAAQEFNDKGKATPERDLRAMLLLCAMRPALTFAHEMIQLDWGANRIDSHVRDFVRNALVWAGLPADTDFEASVQWRQYQDKLFESAELAQVTSKVPIEPAPYKEIQPAEPRTDTKHKSQIDPVAAERTALLTEFKAKGRAVGIRVNDQMVAKAANPGKWNDRTMVAWWKRNDKSSTPGHDKKIRAVLNRDPAMIWPKP